MKPKLTVFERIEAEIKKRPTTDKEADKWIEKAMNTTFRQAFDIMKESNTLFQKGDKLSNKDIKVMADAHLMMIAFRKITCDFVMTAQMAEISSVLKTLGGGK